MCPRRRPDSISAVRSSYPLSSLNRPISSFATRRSSRRSSPLSLCAVGSQSNRWLPFASLSHRPTPPVSVARHSFSFPPPDLHRTVRIANLALSLRLGPACQVFLPLRLRLPRAPPPVTTPPPFPAATPHVASAPADLVRPAPVPTSPFSPLPHPAPTPPLARLNGHHRRHSRARENLPRPPPPYKYPSQSSPSHHYTLHHNQLSLSAARAPPRRSFPLGAAEILRRAIVSAPVPPEPQRRLPQLLRAAVDLPRPSAEPPRRRNTAAPKPLQAVAVFFVAD